MKTTVFIPYALLALVASTASAQPGPALVRVDSVRQEAMAATVQVPGTVVSRNDARVSAEVEGVLVEVVDIGTRVEARQPVARIRNTILELREPELEAQVERERARLEFLDREVSRLERLAEQNNTARTLLDQTQSDRSVARNDMQVAEARLAQIRDQLERTRQKAPFTGVVVERLRRPGERVDVGTPIVRMVDPESLEVIGRAPLEYLPFLHVGNRIPYRHDQGEGVAVVRTLAAVGDENTHVFELRADVAGGVAPVGLTVRLSLPASARREVLSVHRDALVLRPDSIAVFVVQPDRTARRVEVTTGLGSGDRIEVVGGLQPGDSVVVRGNERLRDGQAVQIDGESAPSQATGR